MKLSYRGVRYDYNPPAELTVAGEVMGRYRGAAWRQSILAAPAPQQPAAVLCYRGVTYSTQPGAEVAPQAAAPSVSASAVARASKVAVASAHQRSILASLEHRINAARNRGDERLVHLLEDEMRHFA
jgi:hypothetical protein